MSSLRTLQEQPELLNREAEYALKIVHAWLAAHPIEATSETWWARDASNPEKKKAICRAGFARAKAVAFFQLEKTARVVSRGKGKGFLVVNLGWRDGRPVWSAPCFLQQSHAGLGMSWGNETVTSCYLINTPEAVEALFMQGKVVLGAEGHRTHEAASVMEEDINWAGKNTEEVQIYSVSEGRMLDVGLSAGYLSPAPENREAYGAPRAEPRGILSGKVPAPAEFEPLYEVLDTLVGDGARALRMLRDAGVHVPPVYHSQNEYGSSQC